MPDASQDATPDQFTVEELPATVAGSAIRVTIAGLCQPVVLVLFLIAFFTTVSGKPLDGALMATVGGFLAWNYVSARLRPADAAQPEQVPGEADRAASTARHPALGVVLVAAVGYAILVGAFSRYSWPATIAVVAVGCLAVAVGWQGPVRQRSAAGDLCPRGAGRWGMLLVAGGLWELAALLEQPSIDVSSWGHPTISTLTDPVLASHPGRSLALAAWLALGGWLILR